MIVYVVTCGIYDDFDILAIFSTREAAERCVKDMKGKVANLQISDTPLDTFFSGEGA